MFGGGATLTASEPTAGFARRFNPDAVARDRFRSKAVFGRDAQTICKLSQRHCHHSARLAIGTEQGGRRQRPIHRAWLGARRSYPPSDESATRASQPADRARDAGSHVLSLRQLVAARVRDPRTSVTRSLPPISTRSVVLMLPSTRWGPVRSCKMIPKALRNAGWLSPLHI